jgi:hypothetical protein
VDELVCCKLEEEEEARAEVDLVKLEERVLVPLVRLLVSLERGSACKLAFLSTPFELKDLGIVEEPPLLRPLILAS